MNNENGTTSFIFMGDPQCSRLGGDGSDYSRWSGLLQRAFAEAGKGSKKELPLLVLGGDIVNRGKNKEEEWEAFLEAKDAAGGADLLMATPVNGSEESIGIYADRFINPGNGPLFHEKEFFSFDYGCCHFMFLDSSYMGNRHKDAYKYIGAWIRSDLAVNRQPVVFAVMHHPAFTVGTSFEDDMRAAAIRENYMRLLYRYGVDFILCGHQHVYARTKAQEEQVAQIMGVSGTKFFDARDKSSMDLVSEFVSVATVFETDGETIRLKTIDEAGNVIDICTQAARPPKKRKCGTCDKFSQCRGTGKFEKQEAEQKAKENGDPLKPPNREGIRVLVGGDEDAVVSFSDKELSGFEQVDVEYSVMRRGRLQYERYTGCRLRDLLEKAGTAAQAAADGAILILTNSKGRQKILPLHEVMNARRFGSEGGYVVPPIITSEDGGWRLIFGQQEADQYNGRGWVKDIRQIEIDA